MKKFIPYSLLLFCFFLIFFYSSAQKKYNVIFIAVDDMNIQFDAFGNTDAPAPNFARLMKHGMLFQTTYTQYALCSPSRTSLLSGKRPDATGVYDNVVSTRIVLGKSYKFLPEYFDANGYRTEKYGKVTCGHEDDISWDFVYTGGKEEQYHVSGAPHWWIDTNYATVEQTPHGVLTSAFVDKIKHPVSTPYFYVLGLETHNPFTPLIQPWDQLGDNTVKELLPIDLNGTKTNVRGNGSGNITLPNTPPNDTNDIPEIALHDFIQYPDDECQRIRHAYYGEILEMDSHLGLVLDELDRQNIWDNTVVVFISDHGLHLGEHLGMWLKQSLFEESLRVPFVICAPGKRTGVCTQPVELVDLYSTLAELCGLPAPQDQEGSSLVPLLEKPTIEWKKAVFSQVKRPDYQGGNIMARSVRTSSFHYNSWEGFGEELYDIVNDPHEYINLYNDPSHIDDLNKMRNLLSAGWQNALPPVYEKRSYYRDADSDGWGTSTDSLIAYFKPNGYIKRGGDCNDADPSVNPGAKENPCNGIDDNCTAGIDENRPVPTITPLGDLDICQSGSVTLQANGGAGFTYQWEKNGADISGATQRKYIATVAGNYKVLVANASGCSNTSKKVTVTNSCNAIELNGKNTYDATASSEKLLLYPNPSAGNIKVTYNSGYSGSLQLKVIDITGRTLIVKNEQAIKGVNAFQLNLSALKPATYYLEVNDNSSQKRIKFLIER